MLTPRLNHLPSFWTLASLLLLVTFVPAAWAQFPGQLDESEIQQMTPAQASLTLIHPADAEFDELLNTYFTGVSLLPSYQQLRPLLIILRNQTPRGAKAYAVHWRVHNAEGGLVAEFSERKIATRLMFLPEQVWIKPQEMRLVGPMLNATPEQYQKYFASNPNVLPQMFQVHHLPPVPEGGSVEAILDGVVFADGTFAGPNQSHLWERYVAARNAEHDEALAVLNLLTASTPQPRIVEILRRRMELARGANYPEDLEKTWYLEGRGATAQDLLRILRRQGSNALQEAVQRVANYTPPKGQFTDMRRWTAPAASQAGSPTP